MRIFKNEGDRFMSSNRIRTPSVTFWSIVAMICAAAAVPTLSARAADAAADTDTALNEIIVTGSRVTGIRAADSPAPIQIVSAQALINSGSPDLMSALASLVPSLQMQAFGFDMAGQTLQARLRGISPNDVLVLINGKRRHSTANLAVDVGSPFQGRAGVDLNFIPLDAIDHVEVLTDGAAAQYGSDAIAGVVNIILKTNNSGGTLAGTYGQYGNAGGGRTEDVSGNAGFEAGSGGFLNITGDFRDHGHSNVGAIDPRLLPQNLSTTYPNDNAVNAPGFPYLNRISGDAAVQQKIALLNSGFNFDNGMELYVFGTYGHKDAASYENWRVPSKAAYTDPTTMVTTYPFPYGFNPQESSYEDDYQGNIGFKGTLATWDFDIATGYGGDRVRVSTISSINAGVYGTNGIPQTSNFYDGTLQATQWVSNIDLKRDFNVGLAGPLNIAFGGEYRRETYQITAGVPISWMDGGAQSFPGWTPLDAGTNDRKNYAAYIDFNAKVIENLRVDAAARYEHYSDFGNTTVGKLTARYDFSPEFALRGTVSNGFRAPTLAEEFYSATNVGPTTAYIQLPPNSPAAAPLGLGNGLQPEKSVNLSLGTVWRPLEHMNMTFDLYQITLTNRIVGSGNIAGQINGVAQPGGAAIGNSICLYQGGAWNGTSCSGGTSVIDPGVLATGSYGINIFANGIDTRTRGADLVFDFPFEYSFGKIDWSVSATYNDTTITKYATTPPQLVPNVLYDQEAYSELTTATPKYVINLGALWTYEKLQVNLVEHIWGPSSDYENDDGDNPTGNFQYFEDKVNLTATTNVDISYLFTDNLKLAVGAVNLFNRFPNKLNSTILTREDAAADNAGVTQYPLFSPFGINGGFYYVRAVFKF
ncbi:MAG TPA: TonB-dependent receptor [Steroidobacteraceae bacterium]|nr:TonB-dependent receptor [Steroidobacteraceae bacterium]